MKTCMLALCVVAATGPAAAQEAFDGTWVAEVIRPVSGNQNLTIELKTSEGKVSGSLTVQARSGVAHYMGNDQRQSDYLQGRAPGCQHTAQVRTGYRSGDYSSRAGDRIGKLEFGSRATAKGGFGGPSSFGPVSTRCAPRPW